MRLADRYDPLATSCCTNGRAAGRSNWSSLPIKINGDALMTQACLDIAKLRIKFSSIQLYGGYVAAAQFVYEFQTALTSYFSSFFL